MALKVKKLAVEDDPPRENPAELAAKLSGAVAHLPTTRPPSSPPAAAPQPPVPPPAEPARKERTVLVNFRASRQLAKAIQQASAEHGGTRRWLAKLLHERGYQVPADELTPPPPARRSYD